MVDDAMCIHIIYMRTEKKTLIENDNVPRVPMYNVMYDNMYVFECCRFVKLKKRVVADCTAARLDDLRGMCIPTAVESQTRMNEWRHGRHGTRRKTSSSKLSANVRVRA